MNICKILNGYIDRFVRIFRSKRLKVTVLGLNRSGKTSIIQKIDKSIKNIKSTKKFQQKYLFVKDDVKFKIKEITHVTRWDKGYDEADCLIYVVNSAECLHLNEKFFTELIERHDNKKALLVLCTMSDKHNSVYCKEVITKMNLMNCKLDDISVFSVSSKTGQNCHLISEWLELRVRDKLL